MSPLAPPQTPAAQPAAPSVTGTGAVALPQNVSRPMTREDVQLLQNRRSELSRQLTSASGRRQEVVREMGRSPNGREGLEARLKVLDERIVQLEQDISQNGQLLASAPANLVAETSPPVNFPSPIRSIDGTAISIVFTLFVMFPIAFAWARRILKRPQPVTPALPPEALDRMARIENAVDSIALEVERISEGQRFVSRLMNETRQLGAGAAEPIVMRQGDKVPVERADSR
ncbi:MAG: hypothetical protein P3B98_11810 [Gemmatimonadota bacterium]|nr:hypothetical protein [Gemmatimonadota bacterium]